MSLRFPCIPPAFLVPFPFISLSFPPRGRTNKAQRSAAWACGVFWFPSSLDVTPQHFASLHENCIRASLGNPTEPRTDTGPPSFPVMSLSVPLRLPFMFPCFPPLLSLHFLAFPLRSPVFFREKQKTRVSQHVRKHAVKGRVFPDFRQKEAENPNQQRAGRGIRAWDPCFVTPAPQRLRLVERDVGRRGGGYPLSSLKLCPLVQIQAKSCFQGPPAFLGLTCADWDG